MLKLFCVLPALINGDCIFNDSKQEIPALCFTSLNNGYPVITAELRPFITPGREFTGVRSGTQIEFKMDVSRQDKTRSVCSYTRSDMTIGLMGCPSEKTFHTIEKAIEIRLTPGETPMMYFKVSSESAVKWTHWMPVLMPDSRPHPSMPRIMGDNFDGLIDYPSPPNCGLNAEWTDCASACEWANSCQNQWKIMSGIIRWVVCTMQCVKRCICNHGFRLDDSTGECIHASECPLPTCGVNEVWNSCQKMSEIYVLAMKSNATSAARGVLNWPAAPS